MAGLQRDLPRTRPLGSAAGWVGIASAFALAGPLDIGEAWRNASHSPMRYRQVARVKEAAIARTRGVHMELKRALISGCSRSNWDGR